MLIIKLSVASGNSILDKSAPSSRGELGSEHILKHLTRCVESVPRSPILWRIGRLTTEVNTGKETACVDRSCFGRDPVNVMQLQPDATH